MFKFLEKLNNSKFLEKLNNSKLLAGLAMLLLNLGSKYIELKFTKTQEEYIKTAIGRELIIFVIIFVGTHDVLISILMTAAFVILADTAFNDKSKYCIMPKKFKKLQSVIDTNNDNIITEDEINKAHEILYKASMQNNKLSQKNNINFFQNNI